jgi:uncharacterized protein (TIGR03067 family)
VDSVQGAGQPAADPSPKPTEPEQKPTDAEELQGTWTGAIAEHGGQPWAEYEKERGKVRVRIKGDTLTLRADVVLLPRTIAVDIAPADTSFAFELDERTKPGWIDLPLPQAQDDVKPLDVLVLSAPDGEPLTLCLNCPNNHPFQPAERSLRRSCSAASPPQDEHNYDSHLDD